MGLFGHMNCTSEWSGIGSWRTCMSMFLFTHVRLFRRSLLWVSFETCVVPPDEIGAHIHLCSCSHMYISIPGLFYGSLLRHASYLTVEWDRL